MFNSIESKDMNTSEVFAVPTAMGVSEGALASQHPTSSEPAFVPMWSQHVSRTVT
ncbi:MAG TPA: hypothetical protein VFY29_12215 [Terriglobia bacterium]|nr:hypothetical protein [Terriglobia bacterium]